MKVLKVARRTLADERFQRLDLADADPGSDRRRHRNLSRCSGSYCCRNRSHAAVLVIMSNVRPAIAVVLSSGRSVHLMRMTPQTCVHGAGIDRHERLMISVRGKS